MRSMRDRRHTEHWLLALAEDQERGEEMETSTDSSVFVSLADERKERDSERVAEIHRERGSLGAVQ
jgi:hypothetical protein